MALFGALRRGGARRRRRAVAVVAIAKPSLPPWQSGAGGSRRRLWRRTLSRLLLTFNEVHTLLGQRADGVADLQFVMVSVDPERDTTLVLRRYVPSFNRDFVGVTGDAATIARLADSVGAVYAKVPGSSADSYLVDHSSAVVLERAVATARIAGLPDQAPIALSAQ